MSLCSVVAIYAKGYVDNMRNSGLQKTKTTSENFTILHFNIKISLFKNDIVSRIICMKI